MVVEAVLVVDHFGYGKKQQYKNHLVFKKLLSPEKRINSIR